MSEEDAGDLLWVAVGRRRADSLPCGGVDKGFLAPGVARFEQAEISYSDKTTDGGNDEARDHRNNDFLRRR